MIAGFMARRSIVRQKVAGVFVSILVMGPMGALEAEAATTEAVFAQAKGAIVQVRVLDNNSDAQQSIGSGFHVGNGFFISNYHVIAELLDTRQHLHAVARTFDEQELPLELITTDIVHDVALLRAKNVNMPVIALTDQVPARGARLYSVGNPLDIGFTIVEGNYNGLVKGDPRPHIHFTGALNPGVSGGPTINDEGIAVGINVASSGEQVSYLVPGTYAQALLISLPADLSTLTAPTQGELNQRVREQLLAEQSRLTEAFVATPLKQTSFGHLQVPDSHVDWLTCWGGTRSEDKLLLKVSMRSCRSGAPVYLSSGLTTGNISFSQNALDGTLLTSSQFLYQYGKAFKSELPHDDSRKKLLPPVCQHDFFTHNQIVYRAATCIRGYRDYPDIFNVTFYGASQEPDRRGLLTTLRLDGFTVANAKRLITHYVNGIAGDAP